jgi:hypothetical protein
MRNVSDSSFREDESTHFMFINFAQKLCRLWGNVEKLSVGRPATDYHMIWHMKGWIGFPDNQYKSTHTQDM